jgi:hypothetical protein
MTLYTETRDTSSLFLEAGYGDNIKFWQWTRKGGQALESAKTSIRFLNFSEQAVQEEKTVPTYKSLFTTLEKREEKGTVVIPELEGINIHNPAITTTVRNLLRNFWAIVVSKALQAHLKVDKTSIAIFNDTAEDRLQVVLRVFIEANASQAMAFWESLENDIQEWVSKLDDRKRLVFVRDISLRVHWQ